MTNLTVVIPVGPHPSHRRWLDEALESVYPQLLPGDEVLLVDDMASDDLAADLPKPIPGQGRLQIIRNPWRLGVAAAFNIGVATADNEFSLLMGSDDRLLPHCLGDVRATLEDHQFDPQRFRTYFYLGVEYSDGRLQTVPCGAAVVSRTLWRHLGGFPPESATGAQDAALLSIMIGNGNRAGVLCPVNDARPTYWYRVHAESETAVVGPSWQGVILETRNLLTSQWVPAQWGR